MNLLKHFHPYFIWVLFLAYMGGILLTAYTHGNLWDNYRGELLGLAAAIVLASCCSSHIQPAATVVLLAFTLGAGHYSVALHPPSTTTDLSQFCTAHEVSVHASIISIDPQPDRWRMDANLELINDQHLSTPAHGKIRVQVQQPKVAGSDNSRFTVLPGDHIIFRAKLYQPRLLDIPCEFDYPGYLASIGIFTCATIRDSTSIIRMDTHNIGWSRIIERWRCRVGRYIEQSLPPAHSAYLLSLTLGQKSRLSAAQREQLASYGISHLFSISGLHLGLLAWFLYQPINWLYRRSDYLLLKLPAQRAVPLLALPAIFFYLIFSGTATPTIRAALMLGLAAIVLFAQRHTSPINLLALAGLIILGLDPLALFTASFQLSFAAVGAILWCLPSIRRRTQSRATRWLFLPFWLTLIATLATAPIALWHFHTLAPAALVCNLFATPVIGLCTLPMALIGMILMGIIPGIGVILLQCSNWLINLTLTVSQHVARGPLSAKVLFLSPAQYLLIALCCITLLCACRTSRRGSAVMALLTTILWLSSCWQPTPPAMQLTAFSIGQGDALLLRLGTDKTYLIDGGGFYSPNFDVGQRVLAPALGFIGATHLNAVILSHDHPDHRKGLIYILQNFAVDQFWCSIPVVQLHESLQQVLTTRNISVRLFPAGWTNVAVGTGTTLDVFVPPDQRACMNDRSLVLLAHYDHDGVLLTGDLEQHGIEQLLAQPLPAPVTLLKLPHHGSRRSAPRQLFNTTHPKIAIASVGHGNSYGFPHQEVIMEANKSGAQLVRTDLDGTVQFSSAGNGWTTIRL